MCEHHSADLTTFTLASVGLVLALAAFTAPEPFVLAVPGAVLASVALVRAVRRLARGGAR
ncbi:hypothetical protein [Pseudonocardia nigra]|uniref:hypothetical protein n=1 Tax=Pseudonocardia nigra TaxID=1921578 RepID=UPI001C5D7D89|nr:hypothetical protein [Pseudonocardia nigra]